MAETTRDEILAAVAALNLSLDEFRSLPDAEAERVFRAALDRFVGGDDRRWWWERFTDPCVIGPVPRAWTHLSQIVPSPDELIWFIAEDDQASFYPVFETTTRIVERIIPKCFGFEYYLVAQDGGWILCENHHDLLIGAGEPVRTRLAQLSTH